MSWVEQSLTPHPTQYRSFRRRSSQPITWLILTNKAVQENKHAKTKYKSSKADKLKYRKTKLPWFSRLLWHSARKRGGLILQWYQRWAPKPTRGTAVKWLKWCCLAQVLAQFPKVCEAVSLHLVEVSPHLSDMQYHKLTNSSQGSAAAQSESSEPCYRSCVSHHNFNVHWYRHLADVPRAPSFFIAHEFFDALPVHKFQVNDVLILDGQ